MGGDTWGQTPPGVRAVRQIRVATPPSVPWSLALWSMTKGLWLNKCGIVAGPHLSDIPDTLK